MTKFSIDDARKFQDKLKKFQFDLELFLFVINDVDFKNKELLLKMSSSAAWSIRYLRESIEPELR